MTSSKSELITTALLIIFFIFLGFISVNNLKEKGFFSKDEPACLINLPKPVSSVIDFTKTDDNADITIVLHRNVNFAKEESLTSTSLCPANKYHTLRIGRYDQQAAMKLQLVNAAIHNPESMLSIKLTPIDDALGMAVVGEVLLRNTQK